MPLIPVELPSKGVESARVSHRQAPIAIFQSHARQGARTRVLEKATRAGDHPMASVLHGQLWVGKLRLEALVDCQEC
jgi:hypothetical protein